MQFKPGQEGPHTVADPHLGNPLPTRIDKCDGVVIIDPAHPTDAGTAGALSSDSRGGVQRGCLSRVR
ncbi:hypothetical protein GCM10010498_60850 [Streptomyces cavourensis]|nr:hypothetical protein GCM10010498_60850 [Streptomyces cavourensis]